MVEKYERAMFIRYKYVIYKYKRVCVIICSVNILYTYNIINILKTLLTCDALEVLFLLLI